MGAFAQQLGQQVATSAASGAASSAGGEIMSWVGELLFGNRRRKKQIEQQQKLTEIQKEANMQLAEHGMGLQKQLFDYTAAYNSPEQQRKRIEEAGMNPALMYGMQGIGGGTTGSQTTSGVSGSQAANEAELANAATQRIGMGLQMAMQKAQIKNIEADTKQKEAEAEKTATVDTELTKMSIKDITATINNKEVQRESLLLDNDLKILEYTVMYDTTQDRANEIKYRAKSAKETLLELQRNNEIGEEVKQQVIDSYQLRLQDIATDIILKETNTQVNREQAKKIIQDVTNSIKDMELKGKQVDIQEIEAAIKASMPGIQHLIGGFGLKTISWLYQGMPLKNMNNKIDKPEFK